MHHRILFGDVFFLWLSSKINHYWWLWLAERVCVPRTVSQTASLINYLSKPLFPRDSNSALGVGVWMECVACNELLTWPGYVLTQELLGYTPSPLVILLRESAAVNRRDGFLFDLLWARNVTWKDRKCFRTKRMISRWVTTTVKLFKYPTLRAIISP